MNNEKNQNIINIEINEKKYKFYVESELVKYRFETLYDKEPETIEWINRFKPKTQFIDVGSNVGIYSFYASIKNLNNTILSIEPVFSNYKSQKINQAVNEIRNLTVLNAGVSDVTKLGEISILDERIGNSGAQIIGEEYDSKLRSERIIIYSLDDLFKLGIINDSAYVKIDVDGNEIKIIRGMQKVLSNKIVKSLLIEANNKKEGEEIKEILGDFGYILDEEIEKMKNHSSVRRELKKSEIRNLIFNLENS